MSLCPKCGKREKQAKQGYCALCRSEYRQERPSEERRMGKRGEQKRRWDRENKRQIPCACGNPMSRRAQRCRACRSQTIYAECGFKAYNENRRYGE